MFCFSCFGCVRFGSYLWLLVVWLGVFNSVVFIDSLMLYVFMVYWGACFGLLFIARSAVMVGCLFI